MRFSKTATHGCALFSDSNHQNRFQFSRYIKIISNFPSLFLILGGSFWGRPQKGFSNKVIIKLIKYLSGRLQGEKFHFVVVALRSKFLSVDFLPLYVCQSSVNFCSKKCIWNYIMSFHIVTKSICGGDRANWMGGGGKQENSIF